MSTERRASMAARLYRLLLFAYPPSFRRRHGTEMARLFDERLLAAQHASERRRFYADILLDLALSLPREHAARLRAHLGAKSRGARTAAPAGVVSTSSRELHDLLQDLRFAGRTLARQPTFAVVAVLTLALGIGANTAMFSVVHAVVLAPLPYEEPSGIVQVWPGRTFSKRMFDRLRTESRTFDDLAAYSGWSVTLTGDGEPEELDGLVTTASYFSILGIEAAMGRTLLGEDTRPGAEPVAVLSHKLWQRRFGGDPHIVGRTVALSAEVQGAGSRRVVGVLPPGHRPLLGSTDVWLPLVIDPADERDYDGSWYLRVLGRLRNGLPQAVADGEVKQIAARFKATEFRHLTEEDLGRAGTVPLKETLVGDVRTPMLVLLGAVGLVLLVACSNVANLLLARVGNRKPEVAIRTALGASGGRLLRQLVTESLLLAALGGGAGLALAYGTLALLVAHLPQEMPRTADIGVDPVVLAFAIVASLLAGLLFGVVPALRATRGGLHPSTRGSAGRHRLHHLNHLSHVSQVNQGLVVAEVALAAVLVVGAGLLLKSFWRLQAVDPGFRPGGVLVLRVSVPVDRYREPGRQRQFFAEARERIAALPGVESVGAIHLLPLTLGNWGFPYEAEGHSIPADEPPPEANYRVVTPGYFATMGIPLLDGRDFTASDRADGPQFVVLNRTMAHRLWPGESPLGKEIRLFRSLPHTVIGVVGDLRQHRLDLDVQPEMYYVHSQRPLARMHLVVRSDGDPLALAPAVRRAIWSIDPDVPISGVAPMADVVAESVAGSRLVAALLGAFALLALLLGAIGVYGLLSYLVAERTHEIGVRIAVGASGGAILRQVLSRGLTPVALGLGSGLLGALAAGRMLDSLLYTVSPNDPAVFTGVGALLALVAVLACYVPARRAAAVDPIVALRHE